MTISTKGFVGFRKFLLKYEFSTVGPDGDKLLFILDQLQQIIDVNKTEISLDRSSSRAGGRLAVTFYDPHLQRPSRLAAKLLLCCTGIFGSIAT